MKFVISSSTLSAHLMTTGRVIVQKNNLPILDCFCFDIQGGQLTITASDNDSTLITTLPLNECDEDVRFAVNAKILQDAIKEIPEQPLAFYFNPETYEITIEYLNGQYKLMAQDADEYPIPAHGENENVQFTLEGGLLLSGITRSLVAAANDVLRPQLNAICFDVQDGKLCMVATNGNHMALTQYPLGETPNGGTFLLGQRPAGLLRNMLAKEQGDVIIKMGQRSATFTTSEYTLSCRLVEGRYPNYRSVIPQDNPNIVTLNRQAMISALRRIMIFASPGVTLVKFRLEGNSLNLSSQDVDFGKSAEENIPCDYKGDPMSIAFKGTSILELIQNIDSEDITFKLSDRSRAGIIVPAEPNEKEDVLMLRMPSVCSD